MPTHFADFIMESESAGVLVIPQMLPIAAAVEELVMIWALTEASEWANRICALPL